MSAPKAKCQICSDAIAEAGLSYGDAAPFACDRCGSYVVSSVFRDGVASGLSTVQRVTLSFAIRRATDERRTLPTLTNGSYEEVIASSPLPGALEQADLLVTAIATRSSFGEWTKAEHQGAWVARIGLRIFDQLSEMQSQLQDLVQANSEMSPNLRLKLTMSGWRRASELTKARRAGKQAFVAMWFNEAVTTAFSRGIVPALEVTGYRPYRVDLSDHNNKIDDEILSQIRASRLVIADTTGARPSVYYEAGLAHGLGIEVIWSCNSDWVSIDTSRWQANVVDVPNPVDARKWIDMLAFDTRQHNFIFWTSPEDLRVKLEKRIRALGLDLAGPVNPG